MSGSDAQRAFVCQECGTGLPSAGTPHSLDDCRAAWPELKAELERARDEIRELRSALSTAHIDGAESDQIAEEARSERERVYADLDAARSEIETLRMFCDSDEFNVFERLRKKDHSDLAQARARITELRAAIREHAVKAYVDGPEGMFRSGTCDWCHYAWAGAVEVHRLPDCLAALDAAKAAK